MLLQSDRIQCTTSDSHNENWTERLYQAALYFISSTPPSEYCSAIDMQYSTAFKDRALNTILPELFRVARAHEEHVRECLQNKREAPKPKETFTWRLLQKPRRRQTVGKNEAPDALVEENDSKSDQTMAIHNILNG
jgi:hypothetical protein